MPKLDKHIYPSVHRGIVRAALLTLEQESNPAARRYPAELAAVLIEEAAAPDRIGDRQQGRGLHYYCAVKPDGTALKPHSVMQGYVNGKREPAPSPLTMLDSEYRTALALYRAGKKDASMRSLSRALHMLADICCPPHVCGMTYFSRYVYAHKRYEARAAQIFWNTSRREVDEYFASSAWAKQAVGHVPYENYQRLLCGTVPTGENVWQGGTFSQICNGLAESGARELSAVKGDSETVREVSIRRRLLLSVTNCAALLAAFDRDVQDAALRVWEENRPYWLKAPGTAFSITKDALYLHFQDDGSVQLQTEDGRRLAVMSSGRVVLTDNTANCTVNFRFGREPLLTLYPNGDQDRMLALIRGQLHCCRRIGGGLFLSQISFALMRKCPEHAKFIL